MKQIVLLTPSKQHAIRNVVFLCGMFATSFTYAAQLADTPGLTPLQSETGGAVQVTCGGLASLGNQITDNPQNAEEDLFNQCNAMVRTGNEIQNDGPTENSLGLDSTELGGALQNVATEEMGNPSRIATSTLSGQVAAISSHLFEIHNLHLGGASGDEEDGGLLDNRLSMFVNGVGGFGELDASTLEDGADFNSGGIVVGLDYRVTENFVTGLAGGYTRVNSDFQTNINVAGGGINADIGNIALFATYDIANFYVDGIFSYGWSAYDIDRGVVILNNTDSTGGSNRVAKADTDGSQYSFAVDMGYNYQHEALNIRPFIGMDYLHGQIDSYTEQGAFGLNLNVDEQTFKSLQTVVGAQISYAFSSSFGVIIPQFNASWHHEFMNDQRFITARYSADPNGNILGSATDSPDRDFALLGAGVSSVLQGGTQLFLNYQAVVGYSRVASNGFSAGVRLEF